MEHDLGYKFFFGKWLGFAFKTLTTAAQHSRPLKYPARFSALTLLRILSFSQQRFK